MKLVFRPFCIKHSSVWESCHTAEIGPDFMYDVSGIPTQHSSPTTRCTITQGAPRVCRAAFMKSIQSDLPLLDTRSPCHTILWMNVVRYGSSRQSGFEIWMNAQASVDYLWGLPYRAVLSSLQTNHTSELPPSAYCTGRV